MARQKQDGLHYFPFDTDFFYADKRIKRLHARYGNNGIILYIYLLTEIYRKGYYIRWDEDLIDDAIGLNLTEGFIEQVMTFFIDRGLMVKVETGTPNNPDAVITSPGIQKRYQEAVKSLRRDVFVDADIWLLDDMETAAFIKFTQNQPKDGKKEIKCRENGDKSSKNDTKEIKRKESNNIIVAPAGQGNNHKEIIPTDFELKCVDYLIQCILSDFPNQKVPQDMKEKEKWVIHIRRMMETDKIKSSDVWNTLVWTMKDSFWRTNIRSTKKFREKYPTLYLQSRQKGKNAPANKFNGFENQREYDFDALEKDLLAN